VYNFAEEGRPRNSTRALVCCSAKKTYLSFSEVEGRAIEEWASGRCWKKESLKSKAGQASWNAHGLISSPRLFSASEVWRIQYVKKGSQ